MQKIILLILGLILCNNAFAKTKFSEVKKALKKDGYGKAIPEEFHNLNSPKAINPVSVSDFSIVGEKTIEKEQNFTIKKYLGKKKDGIDFIFTFRKIIIL